MHSWLKPIANAFLQKDTETPDQLAPDRLELTQTPVSGRPYEDGQALKALLSKSEDVVTRPFGDFVAVYLEGAVDGPTFQEAVIEKLEKWFQGQRIPPEMATPPDDAEQKGSAQTAPESVQGRAGQEKTGASGSPSPPESKDESTDKTVKPIPVDEYVRKKPERPHVPSFDNFGVTNPEAVGVYSLEQAAREILAGSAVLFGRGFPFAVEVRAPGWPMRPVSGPTAEPSVRSAEDTFVEDLRPNVALVRRKVQDPDLMIKVIPIGGIAKLPAAIAYLNRGQAPARAKQVEDLLRAYQAETVVELGVVRRCLCANQLVVPTTLATERPDRLAKLLYLERVAVLVQNFPNALVVPVQFGEFLSVPDDSMFPAIGSLFLKFIRILAAIIAVYLPSLYIAIIGYSPDLLRLELATFVAGDRAAVPLNAILEIALLLMFLEILLEATVRLPARVSAAGTVVGGLIIGQAIVRAHLVSGLSIVIVASTAVSSWIFSSYEMSVVMRSAQWILSAGAMVFGIPGILCTSFALITLVNAHGAMRTPYLLPLMRRASAPSGSRKTFRPANQVGRQYKKAGGPAMAPRKAG